MNTLLSKWKEIDLFDEKVGWQKEFAIKVLGVCEDIAQKLGEKDSDRSGEKYDESRHLYEVYNDDFIRVVRDFTYAPKNEYNDAPYWHTQVDVTLKRAGQKALSVSDFKMINDYRNLTIEIFRVVSWIDHVELLIPKLGYDEIAKQQAKRKQERFGRLD